MATKVEKDSVSGQYTTGHEWDGIKELNTPLPKWWVYVFFICILWAIGYCIVYPSFPTGSGYLTGVFGWHSRSQVAADIEAAKSSKSVFLSKIQASSVEDIAKDRDLLNFAMAGGAAAFRENCVSCHGSGGAGAYAFPNLTDDQWLWGGTLDDIKTTITYGVRNANGDSRQSEMPAYGTGEPMTDQQLSDLADYVLSLSKSGGSANEQGQAIFNERCVACHGEDGTGNQAMGAPALASGLWLYKAKDPKLQKAEIISQVTKPKNGEMPAWIDHGLDETTIKLLAVYVHSLGGGK